MERGVSCLTPAEIREECERTGSPVPACVLESERRGPLRSRLSLGFGDRYGRAVLTVEFDATALEGWQRWMRQRQASMGGVLDDARPA